MQLRMPMMDNIEVNEQGGKGTRITERYDLIDPLALERMADIMGEGAAKYGENNWRLVPARTHLNHALRHALKWSFGDNKEDHAGHFFTRAMMFLAMALEEEGKARMVLYEGNA